MCIWEIIVMRQCTGVKMTGENWCLFLQPCGWERMQCTCTNRGTPGSLLTASRADRKGEKGEDWVLVVRPKGVNGKDNTGLKGRERKDCNNFTLTNTNTHKLFFYTFITIKDSVNMVWESVLWNVWLQCEGIKVNFVRVWVGKMCERACGVHGLLAAVY